MGIRIFFILLIGLTFIPFVLSPLQATTNEEIIQIQPNSEDPKLYKIIFFKTGILGNIISADIYHFQFKEGKTYIIKAKIKIEAGTFGLDVDGPGGSAGDVDIWDSDRPENERYLSIGFTPTATGDHEVAVGTFIATDGGNYSLYINQQGFAGWWWNLAAGVGFLLIVIVALALMLRKPKKKKKKRKSKKR